MTVVSDASPLHYLILLEVVDVLLKLFGQVQELVGIPTYAELCKGDMDNGQAQWGPRRRGQPSFFFA